jgi:hypothetical protein
MLLVTQGNDQTNRISSGKTNEVLEKGHAAETIFPYKGLASFVAGPFQSEGVIIE